VQEDYYVSALQTYTLHPTVDIGLAGQAYTFKAIGNSFSRYEGLARWQPLYPRLALYGESSAGIAIDKRGPIQNAGPTYRAAIVGTILSKDSSTQYFWQAQATQAFIAPRQMALWGGKAGFSQRVQDFGQTRIALGYLRRRVEDYLPGHIQQILSDSLEASLFLASKIGRNVTFQSDNRLLIPTRAFNYRGFNTSPVSIQNTGFRQTEVYSTQTMAYQSTRFRHTLSLDLSQRNRAYSLTNNLNLPAGNLLERARASEKIKDINEATIGYTYTGAWQVTDRSSLRGAYTGSLLRVNTPSDQNDQDRDETFYTTDLLWNYRWLRALQSGLRLSGSIRQVGFIKGTQSSQNYTERVIRLEPTVGYALGPVRLTSSFGVWATYNVRQFAQEESKNRANRIWIQTYQLRYQAPKRYYLLADLLRRENRIAQLNWSRFTESPIDTVILTDLHLRLGRTFSHRPSGTDITLEAGYKLFRQSRHNLAGVSTPGQPTRQAALHTITRQHGPSLMAVWELPGRGRILLDTWLQWATTKYRYRPSNELFIGQTYTSAQLGAVDRRLYPFFTITGQILLH
jgi:hypothetical protein